jgi:hypothetical protein
VVDRRLLPAAALVLAALVSAGAAPEGPPAVASEEQVKAAFLYHFAQLVEWPAGPPSREAFEIGIVGREDFDRVLRQVVAGKIVHERTIQLRRYDGPEAVRRAPPQVLFVAGSGRQHVLQVLRALKDAPVLTVSDMEGFAEQGGMIGFRITGDGRVGFDINLPRVEQAGLRMSSQLLKLARIVGER